MADLKEAICIPATDIHERAQNPADLPAICLFTITVSLCEMTIVAAIRDRAVSTVLASSANRSQAERRRSGPVTRDGAPLSTVLGRCPGALSVLIS